MVPMLFTPIDEVHGEGSGGVPLTAPGSAIGEPSTALRKQLDDAAMYVKPAQPDVALQRLQQACALSSCVGGPVMLPIELIPSCKTQPAAGPPIAPETTAGSGVSAPSADLR